MLTTTIMKTRPVARLLRKSSLACLAGLLRSYLTVGKRKAGLTTPKGEALELYLSPEVHYAHTGLTWVRPSPALCLWSHICTKKHNVQC